LRDTAGAIAAAGRKAHVVVADLSDLGQVASLAAAARDAFGRLDIVVNNVGGAVPRPFLETSAEQLEEAFHFNVSTAHALVQSAVPLLLENGGGSVVSISSVLALISGRGFLSYGTANGALVHYTKLAAQDLAPRIRVNAIAAGTIATAATEPITGDPEFGHASRGPRRCAGWARRPMSPPRSSTWRRPPVPTSPARCWKSTAACRHPARSRRSRISS
jgi:7-alpha-hydroxysteroid dehydrogenase